MFICVYIRAAHARVASIGEKLVRRRQPNDFDIKSVTRGGARRGHALGMGRAGASALARVGDVRRDRYVRLAARQHGGFFRRGRRS